jgi:hypothetical protein
MTETTTDDDRPTGGDPMTPPVDPLAALLHETLNDDRACVHSPENEWEPLCEELARASGVRGPEDAGLREALEWIAAKADTFCVSDCENGVEVNEETGVTRPCLDSIHLISEKARAALVSLEEAAPQPDTALTVERLRDAIDAIDDPADTHRLWRAMSSQQLAIALSRALGEGAGEGVDRG